MGQVNTYNVMRDHRDGMSISELALKYNRSEQHIRAIVHNRMDTDEIEATFKKNGCIECTPNVSFACKYGRAVQCGYSTNLCNYILRTGVSRGCSPTECTKFEMATEEDRKNEDWLKRQWKW